MAKVKKGATPKAGAAKAGNGKATGNGATHPGTGGIPATAADVTDAAALPKSTIERGVPPSIEQVQTLASPQVQTALADHQDVLAVMGVDGAKFAQDALATAAAGERTLRLFESAFRSLQDYHPRAKAVAKPTTKLSAALRRLDPSSPLRQAFAAFLQERDAARGIARTKRTKQRNARAKAKTAPAPLAGAAPKS
jgi:hypothetical protein